MNLAQRHWRGWLRLPVSLGLLTALPWAVMLALVGALGWWFDAEGGEQQLCALALLLAWTVLVALQLWGSVGAWRAAAETAGAATAVAAAAAQAAEADGNTRRARMAQATIAMLALVTLFAAASSFVPRLPDLVHAAGGSDPLGQLQIAVSADGTRLALRGAIGSGDAARVRRHAEGLAALRLVELQSPGGRLHEARQLAALVHSRGWTTRATGPCDEACSLVFLAGARRQVMPDGAIRLRRVAVHSALPFGQRLANHVWARAWLESGLPQAFVDKALATPPSSLWTLETDELHSGGVITRHERPLDIDLPLPAEAPPAAYTESLTSNPTWWALERRRGGLIDEAATRMHAARGGGLADDVIQAAAQQLIDPLLAQLAARASSELQQELLALLGDQLGAAAELGAAACLRQRSGDVMLRRVLPPSLAQREAAWLAQAAREKPLGREPPRALNPLEREVLRRTLGSSAAAQLAALWRPAAGAAAQDCARSRAIAAAVLQLPVGERRLALRAVFGP